MHTRHSKEAVARPTRLEMGGRRRLIASIIHTRARETIHRKKTKASASADTRQNKCETFSRRKEKESEAANVISEGEHPPRNMYRKQGGQPNFAASTAASHSALHFTGRKVAPSWTAGSCVIMWSCLVRSTPHQKFRCHRQPGAPRRRGRGTSRAGRGRPP